MGRACRGCDHVECPAAGRHPRDETRVRRRHHHPVRLPGMRVPRADQDGLPGAAESHRDRGRGEQHQDQPRHRHRSGGAAADGPGHLRPAAAWRHPRRLPARRRPHAPAAPVDAARLLRRHLRGGRPVPARSDGRGLPQQVRAAQDRAREGGADPSGTRRGAGADPRRDLRPDCLPRAGHGHRPATRRVHAGCRRHAPPCHGQEEEGRAGRPLRALQ